MDSLCLVRRDGDAPATTASAADEQEHVTRNVPPVPGGLPEGTVADEPQDDWKMNTNQDR
jgi:hypothetical protein